MGYPDTINLPFNGAVIKDCFKPINPGEAEPSGGGFWAILRGNALVVGKEGDKYILPEGGLPKWVPAESSAFCIGYWQGQPLRAVQVGRETELPEGYTVEPFNAVEERLDDRLLTIGGLANQILHWERMSAVCSRCASRMQRIPGTWGKRCMACGHDHYPHIHPCIIVLVRRGDEFLLIRKPEWAQGRYSLIAGFLEFGESLEECVYREVKEEAGVDVKNLQYVGSQNWPFPSQLMAGYVAEYAGGEIVVDAAEIEDARWFCREELPQSFPPKRSIARWIIDRYALSGT
jgi:NAD+ diphosphatase